MAHIYLIVLFFVTVVVPIQPTFDDSDFLLMPHWSDVLLLAWLSGLVVEELTSFSDGGSLGWIKIIVLALGSIAFSIHVAAIVYYILVRQSLVLDYSIHHQVHPCFKHNELPI